MSGATTPEPEMLHPPMACCHGEEGEADCAALRAEVCAELQCEPDVLVSAVVYALNWDLDVTITAIPCDMWSAVLSEYEDGTAVKAYVECDRIEDGFALTWKTWKEWFDARKEQQDGAAGN